MKKTYSLYVVMLLSIIPIPLLMDYENFSVSGQSGLDNVMYYFANLFGFISAILFLWLIILGLRGIVVRFFPDLIGINTIHQLLGKYGIIAVLLHPLLLLTTYSQDVLFIIVPSLENNFETYITLGRFALYIFLLIWLTSAITRGKLSFRLWKTIHFLTYAIPPFVFLHSLELGTTITYNDIARYYWYGLFTIYLLAVSYKVLFSVGLGRHKYTVTKVSQLTSDLYELVMVPRGKRIVPRPGQFVYIQIRDIGESHPFSVAKYNNVTGEIVLLSKAIGRFTNELAKLRAEDIVMLDGPYGTFTFELDGRSYDKDIVFIAGGSGIAPFIFRAVNQVKKKEHPYLFFGSRTEEDIIYRDLFEKLMPDHVTYVLSNQDAVPQMEHFEKGFITVDLLKKYLEKPLPEYIFFVCGPPIMMHFVGLELKKAKVPNEKVFMEKFSL